MQPARTPRPRGDEEHRAHLRANVQAAAAGDGHPGHWQLHTWALPDGPGDLMPFAAPDYIEHQFSLLPDWLSHLAGTLGPDHAELIARRGQQAEAG